MKLTPEAQEYLRRVLNLLKKGPHSPKTGICFNLQYAKTTMPNYDCYQMVSFMAIGWKNVTDVISYPIGIVDDSGVDLWAGEQGKLRRSLLRHIRARLLRGDLTDLNQQISDYWKR